MPSSYFYTYNAIFESTLSSTAKVVYAYLCKCADKSGKCFPSHNAIGENCGIGITTVKKSLTELETTGFIKIQGQAREDGSRRVNLYTIIKEGRKGFFSTSTTIFTEELTTKAKLVYLYFSRLSGDTNQVYPSHKTTAKACGLSVAGVRTATNELESNGLIERQVQYRENNGQKSNLYTLLPYTGIPSSESPTPTNNKAKESDLTELEEESTSDDTIQSERETFEFKNIEATTELGHQLEQQDNSILSSNSTPPSRLIASPPATRRLTELNSIMIYTYNNLKTIIFRKKDFIRLKIYELLYYYKQLRKHQGTIQIREPCISVF